MPTIVHDALDRVATAAEIKQYREAIEALPIQCADGKVFDADERSEKRMDDAIENWLLLSLATINWRLTNNTTVPLSLAQLTAYRNEIIQKRAIRAFTIYPEYLTFRATPSTTVRILEDWKDTYTA